MRYFAMIDGERRGPYELDQLVEAGVHPSTYVWCKGMDDWEKAEDVADICRYFRQRIFDKMHPSPIVQQPAPQPEAQPEQQNFPFADNKPEPNIDVPPAPTLFIAIFLTLFCFPVTGLVAIYYSYKARRAWTDSLRSDADKSKNLYSDSERHELRREAHDFDRQAKMWIGITFFLGMILYAFVSHKFI